MKNLLLLAVITLIGFSGCYKEKLRDKPFDVLISTPWIIEAHTSVGFVTEPEVQLKSHCGVPEMVVYNEDSTGYFHYYSRCKPTDSDTLKFNWYMSYDGKVIHYSNFNGDSTVNLVVLLADYNYNNIRMTAGGKYYQRFLDGNYVAMPKP